MSTFRQMALSLPGAMAKDTEALDAVVQVLSMETEGCLISFALNALTGLAAPDCKKTSQDTAELVIYVLHNLPINHETNDLDTQLPVGLGVRFFKAEIEAAE